MPVKVVYITLFTSILAFTCFGQDLGWVKQMGGPDWDEGTSIATDGYGNVYSSGNFRGTVDFDPGSGVFDLTSHGAKDVFISKLNASGDFVWAKQIGGTGWEECHAIAVDVDGNIYITGFFLGITDFDPSAASYNLTSSRGGDAFICKLDSSGNFVWAKQISGTLAVTSYSIAVDDIGNIYTTGYFDGTADFDPGPANFNLTVVGYSDMFISKLDVSGNFVWAKQMGGADGEIGHSIAVDSNGNVYTTGTFFGTVDFDPGPGIFNLSSPGAQNIFISKLNASGEFVWAKKMGGETGYSVAVDNWGYVYVTGYYAWGDISINKLDSSGNLVWAKEIGAFTGYSIAIDNNGNVYTTGQFFGTRDFDPGTGTFTLTAKGSTDSYIIKLDSAGNFAWAVQLGGTDEVQSRSLAIDNNGSIYTIGSFNGTADFDPAPTTFNLTSAGSYDIFVHKLTSNTIGLSENSLNHPFKIYPNPTEGNVMVEFETSHKVLNVVLRNEIGQILETISVEDSNRVELQINGARGMYILEISDQNNQITVVRIIKNN